MPYVVSEQIREPRYWGNTGLTLTRTRSEIAGSSTTITVALVDHADGNYTVTFTPSVDGRHIWMGETSDGIPVTFDWDVVTAAQADILSATVSGYAGTTVGGRIALITVGAVE